MIKEKVIKDIATDLTGWFASWSDDRKFHCIAGAQPTDCAQQHMDTMPDMLFDRAFSLAQLATL